MLIYYIFLAIVMIFATANDKSTKNKLPLFCILAVMVLFAGLRSAEVGTDASGYARSFEEGRGEIEGGWLTQLTKEAGFYYFNLFLSKLSNEYIVLFTGIALLTYTFAITAIKKETEKVAIPLFFFITLGLYTFVFNAARQGLAVAIYMLAFRYLFEKGCKGFIKYCIVVLFAATFHKTVIIALPLYYIFRQPFSIKVLVLNAAMGIGIGAVMPSFLLFASTQESRYALYSTQVGGGEMLTLFYVMVTIFFIYWRKKIDIEYLPKYDVFLNIMLFGTLIFVVVQIEGLYVEMMRFAAYFQVVSIFLWAYIYQSKTRPTSFFSLAIIAGHLAYYFIFCSKMANLVPYSFNPSVF